MSGWLAKLYGSPLWPNEAPGRRTTRDQRFPIAESQTYKALLGTHAPRTGTTGIHLNLATASLTTGMRLYTGSTGEWAREDVGRGTAAYQTSKQRVNTPFSGPTACQERVQTAIKGSPWPPDVKGPNARTVPGDVVISNLAQRAEKANTYPQSPLEDGRYVDRGPDRRNV